MEKETILCAAVWYKELPLLNEAPLRLRGFSPDNVDRGIVMCGWRHANIIHQKYALTGLSDAKSGEFEQGFLTSRNRFLGRKEAHDLFVENGGVPEFKGTLYSEDLY